jgi:Ca-activated chloride channel homolog
MTRRYIFIALITGIFFGSVSRTTAQDDQMRIRVRVNLVQLNVAVTDRDGNYVTGLGPQDFSVTEDKIPEKIATFEEGNEAARTLTNSGTPGAPSADEVKAEGQASPDAATHVAASPYTDADVFILFDTSNYMYRGFVFAQDAIAGFVRSLQGANKVAIYSYSRNLSRAAPLTSDRERVLQGLRSTVAGDDAALYNCLLLTVKDAARISGRKVIVVFSNGPDNASVVPPEVVAELAQSTGTVIYMVSTQEAQMEPVSTAVFERMSKATGGKAYFAKSWRDETKAFASIQEDLAHLYSVSYYPQPNPNRGWRTITVKLVGKNLQKYHIRTRDGYRLEQVKASEEDLAEVGSGAAK